MIKSLDRLCPKRIAVRMPNWLGDAVMASSVLSQLKALWPQASLSIIINKSIGQLFAYDSRVHSIICLPAKKNSFPYSSFHRKLQEDRFDLMVVLTNSFSTAWQAWCSRASYRVGYANDARSFLLTHSVKFPPARMSQHLVITYQALLRAVCQKAKELPIFAPKVELGHLLKQSCRNKIQLMSRGSRVIGLNPSAAYGPAKQWPAERFKALAQRLVSHGYCVLVFGESCAKDLGSYISEGIESNCHNLVGATDMMEFVGFMDQCDALVTNDSGPMHVAAALQKPLVAIFGSTDDTVTGPYGSGQVIHKRVECSPCFLRQCPIDFRCMMQIDVEEVYQALMNQLASDL